MLLDSVTIRLIKGGVGIGPDYSLSIYGTSKVLYEGVDKVKVKGVVEVFIDKDKVLLLLSEFKEKGFFSLNESYGEEDTKVRPYTKISISFQKEDGETVTKKVKYYKGDINAPKELIALEDKIEEIVNTSKWVGGLFEYTGPEPKKEPEQIVKSVDRTEKEKPHKKKSSRLITVAAVLAIVAMVIIVVYLGIFIQPSQEKKSSNEVPNINYLTPVITVLKTASNVTSIGVYDAETIFNQSDKVWVYQEYTNISTINNQTCNITIYLVVKDYKGNITHVDIVNKTEIGNYGQAWWFVTDESWPIGVYYVTSTLVDNISNKNATGTAVFVLM